MNSHRSYEIQISYWGGQMLNLFFYGDAKLQATLKNIKKLKILKNGSFPMENIKGIYEPRGVASLTPRAPWLLIKPH